MALLTASGAGDMLYFLARFGCNLKSKNKVVMHVAQTP